VAPIRGSTRDQGSPGKATHRASPTSSPPDLKGPKPQHQPTKRSDDAPRGVATARPAPAPAGGDNTKRGKRHMQQQGRTPAQHHCSPHMMQAGNTPSLAAGAQLSTYRGASPGKPSATEHTSHTHVDTHWQHMRPHPDVHAHTPVTGTIQPVRAGR
jgi:hypothetical protein